MEKYSLCVWGISGMGDAWVTWVAVISSAVGVMTYPLVNFLARRVGKKPLLLAMIFVAVSVEVYIFYNDQEIVRTIREHTASEGKSS